LPRHEISNETSTGCCPRENLRRRKREKPLYLSLDEEGSKGRGVVEGGAGSRRKGRTRGALKRHEEGSIPLSLGRKGKKGTVRDSSGKGKKKARVREGAGATFEDSTGR